jgi:protein-L-isoaspartate(D-aspartate) O-methyltransferase
VRLAALVILALSLLVPLGMSAACGAGGQPPAAPGETWFEAQRRRMVAEQVEARGVTDPAVLTAMRAVPRHRFVPEALRTLAYDDGPLPIAEGQTISQPYIVALMTSLIKPKPGMRVLEVGTGSGYQAAVLARCVAEVDTIEVRPALGRQAEQTLRALGVKNVRVRVGDGFDGWPERAPYDAILLTAAPPELPRPLLDQLKVGGLLVAPVGADDAHQDLIVVTRTAAGFTRQTVLPVRFVPMVGKAATAPSR